MYPLKKGKITTQAHVGLPRGHSKKSTGAKASTASPRTCIMRTRLPAGSVSKASYGRIASI